MLRIIRVKARGVEAGAGWPVQADLGHADDDLGALLDGLGALEHVQIGRGEAGFHRVDPDPRNGFAYRKVIMFTAALDAGYADPGVVIRAMRAQSTAYVNYHLRRRRKASAGTHV